MSLDKGWPVSIQEARYITRLAWFVIMGFSLSNGQHAAGFNSGFGRGLEENIFRVKRTGFCIVSHCYREGDEVIRIISARPAEKSEKEYYNEQFT